MLNSSDSKQTIKIFKIYLPINISVTIQKTNSMRNLGIPFLIALKAIALFTFFTINTILGLILLPIQFLVPILPLFLGKSSDGKFPLWSLIIFGPFLYFVRAFSAIRRFQSGDDPFNEICEGLYLGGWPDSPDKLPPGNPAIVDCTCELPRKKWLSGNAYLCIPAWDKTAPRPEQIEAAVNWACEKRAQNTPVFIHCAYGHGRSVTVMCAVLMALSLAEDWKSAEKMIKEKRSCIHLNALHRSALKEWSKQRLSPHKGTNL